MHKSGRHLLKWKYLTWDLFVNFDFCIFCKWYVMSRPIIYIALFGVRLAKVIFLVLCVCMPVCVGFLGPSSAPLFMYCCVPGSPRKPFHLQSVKLKKRASYIWTQGRGDFTQKQYKSWIAWHTTLPPVTTPANSIFGLCAINRIKLNSLHKKHINPQ